MSYSEGGELAGTAFRIAEKKYKLHREQVFRKHKGRLRGGKLRTRPCDLSDVIDFTSTDLFTQQLPTSSELSAFEPVSRQQTGPAEQVVKKLPFGSVVTPPCAEYGSVSVPEEGLVKLEASSDIQYGAETGGDLKKKTIPTITRVSSLVVDEDKKPVYSFAGYDGFYFIPGALSTSEQRALIVASLRDFPEAPNRTNHSMEYGTLPGLWDASQRDLVRIRAGSAGRTDARTPQTSCQDNNDNNDPDSLAHSAAGQRMQEVEGGKLASHTPLPSDTCQQSDGWEEPRRKDFDPGDGRDGMVSAKRLMRQLRWATLGVQFNWAERKYDDGVTGQKVPLELVQVSERLASICSSSGRFRAEAVIVNYYGPGDTLGGHTDAVEGDLDEPIVSLSLGCKGLFLLGGASRHDPPVAMFVRSGDAMLLSGPARLRYHGVPRIFAGPEDEADVPPDLLSALGDRSMEDYIQSSRINMSVRHVSPPPNSNMVAT